MTTKEKPRPGTRLRSRTCSTEVIVVRPGTGAVDLTCGGQPMIEFEADPGDPIPPASGLDNGTQVGKRYRADSDPEMEVLVTRAGAGTLADGAVPLVPKSAKPLPASD